MLNTGEQQVLFLIKTDSEQAKYFFTRVKSLKWFETLKEQGYFNPANIPFTAEGEASFWDVLDYLERVSEQTIENPQYGHELIKIIHNIVQFSKNIKKIKNLHIWWYCLRIINNLPSEVISKEIVSDKLRLWLEVWLDHSMGSDLLISGLSEKLLPKFLDNAFGPEYDYAEIIVDIITKIKASEKPDPLSKRNESFMAWDPYWIIDAFKKNRLLIGQKCSSDLIFKLADRLNNALKYDHKDNSITLEIGEGIYQIEVSRMEDAKSETEEITFIEGEYLGSIKQYSREQVEQIRGNNDYRKYLITEPENILHQFNFKAASKTEMVREITNNLPERINWPSVGNLNERLANIHNGLNFDHLGIWFKSLTDDESGLNTRDAKRVLTILMRDVLLAKCEYHRLEGKKILEKLASAQYPFQVFKRLVLLCVDKYWADYSDLFTNFIDSNPTALEQSDFEIEIYDIFLNHNREFGPELLGKIKGLIDNVPKTYIDEGEKTVARWRRKWLSPLRENHEFIGLYEEALQKAELKDSKPYIPERKACEVHMHVPASPLSKEEILNKPIKEIVGFLKEFQDVDRISRFEGVPDKEGLENALQAVVKENPRWLIDNFDEFQNVEDSYLNSMFRGLREAWNGKEVEIDWGRIFDFVVGYLERNAMTIQTNEGVQDNHHMVIESMADLINDGCKEDNHAFDPKYFEKAERIFEMFMPFLGAGTGMGIQRDVLTYALNTVLGRTIMAYISFALRVARSTQRKEEAWGSKKYERLFSKGIESYIWFGDYLPQMNYLDREYTKAKIVDLAERAANDHEWRMFMEGYLSGASVYKNIFNLMRGNYTKALKIKDFDEDVDRRLVEHICVNYLYSDEILTPLNAESGEENLFIKMLSEAGTLEKRGRWLKVVEYFRTLTLMDPKQKGEGKIPREAKNKILKFWAWTYKGQEFVKNILADDYNAFLGSLADLTVLLDKIDEEKEQWLLLCAPNVERFHSYLFIKYLEKFEDADSIKRIGKIFLKLLENATPSFQEEYIERIVRKLYSNGNKDYANDICNTYGRRGLHFLKPVWEENQKKESI